MHDHDVEEHCKTVIDAILERRIVPFLGAGANLCDRKPGDHWNLTRTDFLPSGKELALHLAEKGRYPHKQEPHRSDLARVSQYLVVKNGKGPLYEDLRSIFNKEFDLTSLHRFWAEVPALLEKSGQPQRPEPWRRFLIVTTNYDDLLERAFQDAGRQFNLVTYEAEGRMSGKFYHRPPEGEFELIESANNYMGLMDNRESIILKIHGRIDRIDDKLDSIVITEDHYIEYLTRTELKSLLPLPLPAMLRKNHLLFLGHALQDWNLRVILHRIWGNRRLDWQSWAVQLPPDDLDEVQVKLWEIEKMYWDKHGVRILAMALDEYVRKLQQNLIARLAADEV